MEVHREINVVDEYIAENVLQSKVWDVADSRTRTKAINNAQRILRMMLPNKYKSDEEIPVEHIAEQSIWMLKIDDSLQRSELGITYINVDGVALNLSEKDRSIAPFIYRVFNLPKGYFDKRRVVRYAPTPQQLYRRHNIQLKENYVRP